MKNLYIIGGTMGVGKTSVCRRLKQNLNNCVFLDGDNCWETSPLLNTEETRAMAMDNVCHLLNNFIKCSAYDNIVFCWVMHEQNIIDEMLKNLDTSNCNVKLISLTCNETTLTARLRSEIINDIRTKDIISRSLERLPLYESLNTVKVDNSNKSIDKVVEEILGI